MHRFRIEGNQKIHTIVASLVVLFSQCCSKLVRPAQRFQLCAFRLGPLVPCRFAANGVAKMKPKQRQRLARCVCRACSMTACLIHQGWMLCLTCWDLIVRLRTFRLRRSAFRNGQAWRRGQMRTSRPSSRADGAQGLRCVLPGICCGGASAH